MVSREKPIISPHTRRIEPEERAIASVYLLPSQLERLGVLEQQQGCSRSYLIREAIDRLLKEAGV